MQVHYINWKCLYRIDGIEVWFVGCKYLIIDRDSRNSEYFEKYIDKDKYIDKFRKLYVEKAYRDIYAINNRG